MLSVCFDIFLHDGDVANETLRGQLRELFCGRRPHRRRRASVEEDEEPIQPMRGRRGGASMSREL